MGASKCLIIVFISFALLHSAASQRHSQSNWIDAINPLRWFSSQTDLSVDAGDGPSTAPRRRQVLNEQILRRIGQSESDFQMNVAPRTRRRDGQLPAAAVAAQRRAINVAVDGGRFKERPDLNDPSADFKDYSIGLKDFTKGTKKAPADQYPTDHIPDLIMSEYFDQKYGKVARPTADCICRCDCCDCCPCNGNDLHYVD